MLAEGSAPLGAGLNAALFIGLVRGSEEILPSVSSAFSAPEIQVENLGCGVCAEACGRAGIYVGFGFLDEAFADGLVLDTAQGAERSLISDGMEMSEESDGTGGSDGLAGVGHGFGVDEFVELFGG